MSGADKRLTPVEQHLGDRLAALVDGELGHDARERVLSHLATCHGCKAEADEQRRLKNVFAGTAPPPPSDGLLARLQGLPAGGGRSGSDAGPGDAATGVPGGGPTGGALGRRSPLRFDQLPGGSGAGALTPDGGFRIHRGQERDGSASRGRRFAFVAASAFSLAALALGGPVSSGSLGAGAAPAGERGGSTAGQVRTASSAATADRDARRRTSTGGDRTGTRGTSVAPGPLATTALTTQTGGAEGLTGAVSGSHPLLAGAAYAYTTSLIRPPELPRLFPRAHRPAIGAVPGRSPVGPGSTATAPAPPAVPQP